MKKSPFKQSSSLKIALLLSKIVTLVSGTDFSLNRKYFLHQKSCHAYKNWVTPLAKSCHATRNRVTISVAEPNLHSGPKIISRL